LRLVTVGAPGWSEVIAYLGDSAAETVTGPGQAFIVSAGTVLTAAHEESRGQCLGA